jgi:hypothetical protein
MARVIQANPCAEAVSIPIPCDAIVEATLPRTRIIGSCLKMMVLLSKDSPDLANN